MKFHILIPHEKISPAFVKTPTSKKLEEHIVLGHLCIHAFMHQSVRASITLFIPCHSIVAGYYGFMLDVRVSVRPSVFFFSDDNLSKHQWIFTKLGMCIDIVEIWFRQHCFMEIDHEIFSTVILPLPLIQEGQLSVSGERMCTILVNRLED